MTEEPSSILNDSRDPLADDQRNSIDKQDYVQVSSISREQLALCSAIMELNYEKQGQNPFAATEKSNLYTPYYELYKSRQPSLLQRADLDAKAKQDKIKLESTLEVDQNIPTNNNKNGGSKMEYNK